MGEFDYDRVIEIADLLKELGISDELVQEIKDSAWVRAQQVISKVNNT